MNRTAGILWAIGSIGLLIVISIYVGIYQPGDNTDAEKTNFILENWQALSNVWKSELIFIILLTISSLSFAIQTKSIAWLIISLAHILMLSMYPLMLGAYPTASENFANYPALYPIINTVAVWIFTVSNTLFLIGISQVFYTDKLMKKWISRTGMVLSLLALLIFIALFFELVTFSQVVMVGPLVSIIYLINTWYGIKIYKAAEFEN